ncbi:MAG: peptide ABC transporter substrate-binding protein [Bacillota bacterium]|nr:peptide ABC transporter substrate-binding protein [Bacillota bacterium]
MKKISLLLTAVLLATMLSGCGGKTGGGAATASGSAAASANSGKKALNICRQAELATMDSCQASDQDSLMAIISTIEPLYVNNSEGVPVPGTAESYETSEDGKTYTFHIRKDASWSNGDPVTANDFVYAWRRLSDPKTAAEYNTLLEVASIKNATDVISGKMPTDKLGVSAKDDKTLVVELDYPVTFFLSLVTFPSFCPLNQKFVEEKGDKYASGVENLLSCGPYMMDSWDVGGNTYKLVKNPKYYNAGSVKVDEINFQVIKDFQQAMLAYKNGDEDFTYLSGETTISQMKNEPGFTQVESGYLWFMTPNIAPKSKNYSCGLENVNLRKAVAMSYDKDAICKDILKDGSFPADFAIPVKLAKGPDGKDFRDTAPGILKTDKNKAKELWEQAKKELGVDTVNIELLYDDAETTPLVAQFIQNEVETNLPGVKFTLKAQPKKNRVQLMLDREYELGLNRWGPDYADPMTYLNLWKGDAISNSGNFQNPEYDSLLKNATSGEFANDPAKRWNALQQAEKIILDDVAMMPVYQQGTTAMIRPGFTGLGLFPVGVASYGFVDMNK